jgi:hypothetical protein
MATPVGKCHICGAYGPLSFEHVPPRAAFNSNALFMARLDHFIKTGKPMSEFGQTVGKQYQRGAGAHTLCGQCNSTTGAWYGNAYVDWVTQGFKYLGYACSAPSLVFPFTVFPLLVIKQITCMFLCINGEDFADAHPQLVRFVLSRHERSFPSYIRVYAFYTATSMIRQSGITTAMSIDPDFEPRVTSEIVFPPFGYVLTFSSVSPDPRLLDITFFHRYSALDLAELSLPIPILSADTWIPGQYS